MPIHQNVWKYKIIAFFLIGTFKMTVNSPIYSQTVKIFIY